MQDQVNGHETPAAAQDENAEGKPEFPFVRNVVPNPDGSTTLVYNFPNGHFAGTLNFRAIGPQALVPMAEDFRRMASEIEAKVAEMAKAAAQARREEGPRVAVAGADALGKLRRPQ